MFQMRREGQREREGERESERERAREQERGREREREREERGRGALVEGEPLPGQRYSIYMWGCKYNSLQPHM
jgi:hypothetical protein